jgi:hypothetical protein
LLTHHITKKRKKKKGRKREYPPFFRPTPAPHPTQEIARKKKILKKNHSSQDHPIKHLYSLKSYIQKKTFERERDIQ